jgi:hypothetical protein
LSLLLTEYELVPSILFSSHFNIIKLFLLCSFIIFIFSCALFVFSLFCVSRF